MREEITFVVEKMKSRMSSSHRGTTRQGKVASPRRARTSKSRRKPLAKLCARISTKRSAPHVSGCTSSPIQFWRQREAPARSFRPRSSRRCSGWALQSCGRKAHAFACSEERPASRSRITRQSCRRRSKASYGKPASRSKLFEKRCSRWLDGQLQSAESVVANAAIILNAASTRASFG